jgi:hypothetical protein
MAKPHGNISTVLWTTFLIAGAALGASAQEQFGKGWKTDFSKHTVPLDEIVSGGPPKDGIPPIDEPKFESVDKADRWLGDRHPVIVVDIDGIAKAYPLGILMMHEIVNDVVGETPVTVTYCPLCNTALTFDRRFNGMLLDFGTTGNLRFSDLVMYDRQTETWWQQAVGEGIVGEFAGARLTFVASPLVSWATFKETHPGGQVLSRDTGFPDRRRWYGNNPYEDYDSQRSPIAQFFRTKRDNRLPAMERVVALESDDEAYAYAFSKLAEDRVVNDEIGGRPVAVFWSPGTASAVDSRSIDDGADVGSTGVFDRRLDGRELDFEADGDGHFKDRQTGSTWDILGNAVDGPLKGKHLQAVVHGNHFWFAWGAFRPDTKIR